MSETKEKLQIKGKQFKWDFKSIFIDDKIANFTVS
jgi:hypothetical protein